jgi:transglutaminase-like putative cysteine protease
MKGFCTLLVISAFLVSLSYASRSSSLEDIFHCNRTDDCLLLPSKNCQSEDPRIVKLAEQEFSNGTTFHIGDHYFNYVLNRWTYAWYDNTRYGALGMLHEESGNCCDHAHIMVALSRAACIPTRFVESQIVLEIQWKICQNL